MNCKFCNAELAEDVTLCPVCGKENGEELLCAEEIPEEVAVEMAAEEAVAVTGEEAAEETFEEAAAEMTEEGEAAEIGEEVLAPAPKKTKLWLAIAGIVVLLGVLVCAVLYGIGAFDKTSPSYTVSAEKADSVRDTVVANVGDVELTNSELQIYYWTAVNDYYSYYGYYIDPNTLDITKPLDTQVYDEETGTTWQQYFLDNALNVWSRYAALRMQAQSEGYTLSAELQEYMEQMPGQLDEMAATYGYNNAQEMLEKDMGTVCDKTGYLAYLYTNVYAGEYLESLYDTMIPTMEEIETYYTTNEAALNEQGIAKDSGKSVDVRHILICPQGGTEGEDGTVTYSDEEWETCRAKAQEILDRWSAEGADEETFANLAMECSEDPGSQSNGGLYTDVLVGQMVVPFEEWCFDDSRKVGDTGLVQTTYGYHVMFFSGSEDLWVSDVRDTIINERSFALVNGAVETWPVEVKENKIALGESNSLMTLDTNEG